MEEKRGKKAAQGFEKSTAAFLGKTLLLLLETVVLAAALLLGAMFVVTHGPSEAAKRLFVMSVKETSAMGFLADWFLSPEEV